MSSLEKLLNLQKLPRRGTSHQDSSKLHKQEPPVWDSPNLVRLARLNDERLDAAAKTGIAANTFSARIYLRSLMQCKGPMRRTLLAVGFAVLVSMLLAPHGGRSGVEGWGPFFFTQGFHLTSTRIWYGNAGRVMIDMLALEMVFLAVLFAVVVNIRWRREKHPIKPTSA
jgi:hypothetical protein